VHSDGRAGAIPLSIRVDQGVPRLLYWFLALLGVSLLPLFIGIYQIIFESRRWKDSNVA
jgi:hypothetical protein